MTTVQRVVELLGGPEVLRRELHTLRDLDRAVRDGLPLASLDALTERLTDDPRSRRDLQNRVVPRSTRYRREKQGERLEAEESQRLQRLAHLVALAEEVWQDSEDAREFLTTAQPSLGGDRPVDLIETDLGVRRVEELLTRMEHSLPV